MDCCNWPAARKPLAARRKAAPRSCGTRHPSAKVARFDAAICASAFHTSDIRNVPQSEKFAVEREYGMSPGFYGRTIEIDHIIPLELGGSNDIANLFPEPGSGAAGYRAKDRLENKLHALVCAGQLTLSAVQAQITSDWRTLYGEVYGEAPRR